MFPQLFFIWEIIAFFNYGKYFLHFILYTPDLASTDFHIFRSLLNAMRGVSFNTAAR